MLAYIEPGVTAIEAYRRSYKPSARMSYTTIKRRAHDIVHNPRVAARIEELRRSAADKVGYGLQQAMLEAERAYKVAEEGRNGGAMVAAATLRAKLNGLLIDRKEIRTGPLDDLTRDDLKAIDAALSTIGASVGAVAGSSGRVTH